MDYRPLLFVTDGVALGLAIAAISSAHEARLRTFAYASMGVFVLGAPTVHLAYGQPKLAAMSLALRISAPLVGTIAGITIGLVAGCTFGEDGGACLGGAGLGAFAGFTAGIVTTIVVDDGFWGKVALKQPPAASRSTTAAPRLGFLPLLDPRLKAIGIALAGAH